MAYSPPNVVLYQEYVPAAAGAESPLHACVIGPAASLHRYDVAAERPLISVGLYDHLESRTYSWPGRNPGGIVDFSSVKLIAENALLNYFHDLIGVTDEGRGTVTPVPGYRNRVKSSAVNFRSNGVSYPRHALLYDRDVAVGDVVHIRGVYDPDGDCETLELWSYVDGVVTDAEPSVVGEATADSSNQGSTVASTSVEQTGGALNCVSLTVDGAAFNGLAAGVVEETYTITVVKSSVAGCNAARLRITSDSGKDDQEEVDPGIVGEEFDIGANGLIGLFVVGSGDCEADAAAAGISVDQLEIGQQWTVTVSQDFEAACAISGGEFTGSWNDTYIVEVTRGGLWADSPQIVVTTANGRDYAGPITVESDYDEITIGKYGVTLTFADCFGSDTASAAAAGDASGGDLALAGLCAGDRFHIPVTGIGNGNVRTLVLRHDLPTKLLNATDLDLRLFMVQTLEVSQDQLDNPPNENYEIEDTQIIINAGMTAYHPAWTNNGTQLPLPIWSGHVSEFTGEQFSVLYVEYREWRQDIVGDVVRVSLDTLDDIPGQLDRLNTVKWGAYRALQNSNGTEVDVLCISQPDDLNAYEIPLSKLVGRVDTYNLVPLTFNRDEIDLVHALVTQESSPERRMFKGMFAGIKPVWTRAIVSASASLDGNTVLATIGDDPEATGTQYTQLSAGANSGFVANNVRPGDTVRLLYTVDAFGREAYSTAIVDRVLSENSLLLTGAVERPITVAQKIEIWRSLSPSAVVADVSSQAASFGDMRVCPVFPHLIGSAGTFEEGYFAAAAIAGQVSGVASNQPLTRAPLKGYDDASAYTTKLFSEAQLNQMAGAGVWLLVEDASGAVITRHGLTSAAGDNDVKTANEVFRRNVDAVSLSFVSMLLEYNGVTNISRQLLARLRFLIQNRIKYFKSVGSNSAIGPRIIEGSIALTESGEEILRVHPLFEDTVEIAVDMEFPKPLNHIIMRLRIT